MNNDTIEHIRKKLKSIRKQCDEIEKLLESDATLTTLPSVKTEELASIGKTGNGTLLVIMNRQEIEKLFNTGKYNLYLTNISSVGPQDTMLTFTKAAKYGNNHTSVNVIYSHSNQELSFIHQMLLDCYGLNTDTFLRTLLRKVKNGEVVAQYHPIPHLRLIAINVVSTETLSMSLVSHRNRTYLFEIGMYNSLAGSMR